MMKSPRKRSRYVIRAAVAAAALVLTGCTPAAPPDDGKLTIFAPQAEGADFKTNGFSKFAEKKFDVMFDWQTTSTDAAAQKEARQVSLASGDFPDAYLLQGDGFTRPDLLKYAKQGIVIPLNDLIDEYAPNLQKVMEANPDWAASLYAPDGNIYGLSTADSCLHCQYPGKAWINTPWLEKLGLDSPKTTEDLREVLTAFKNEDPNGNGQADEIPFTGATGTPYVCPVAFLMNAFTYADCNFGGSSPGPIVWDGDELKFNATDDKWRAGLQYIASLYEDGLISPATFTQNGEGLMAQGNAGPVATVGAAGGINPWTFINWAPEDKRDAQYDPIEPLTGPDGTQLAAWSSTVPNTYRFVLTSHASEADRVDAIKLIDYLFSLEGTLIGGWGQKDIGWVEAEPGDVALNTEVEAKWNWTSDPALNDKKKNSAWGFLAAFNLTADFRDTQAQSTDVYGPEGSERRLFDGTQSYKEASGEDQQFKYWQLWVEPANASDLATAQTNITDYLTRATAEFITGQRDASNDGDWKKYLSELDGLGLDNYLKLWKDTWDANQQKN